MSSSSVNPSRPLWRRPTTLRILAIALSAEIAYAVLNFSTMPVYLTFDRRYGESLVGLVLAAFLLFEAVFKGAMGALADRVGRKRLIVLGPALSLMACLGTLAVPHGYGIWEALALVALRGLDGIGAAMIWPALFAQLSDQVADHERQQGMSLLNVCYLAGIALAFPFGGLANDLTGTFTASLWMAAALFGAASALGYLFVPSGREIRARHARRAGGQFRWTELIAAARQVPGLIGLALVVFMGTGFPVATVKLFAKQQLGLGEAQFGLIVLPVMLGMIAFAYPVSRLGTRLGRVRSARLGLGLGVAGMAVVSSGAVLEATRSAWVIGFAAVPVGIGFLLAIPAWYASVSDVDSGSRATNLGAVMAAQGVGAIVGAFVGAALYEKVSLVSVTIGRYSPFLACTLCLAIGFVLSFRLLGERPPRGVSSPGPAKTPVP